LGIGDNSVKRLLTIILFLLAVYPAFVVAAVKSPADYIEKFIENDEIIWLGEVVSSRAFKNDSNETVIEFLCRYYELVEPVDVKAYAEVSKDKKERPILKARKTVKNQFFVATIRTQTMPMEVANEIVADTKKKLHYALRNAHTVFVGDYEGTKAVYIGGGNGVVGEDLKVVFIDEPVPNPAFKRDAAQKRVAP
jgi:hypothetical protein